MKHTCTLPRLLLAGKGGDENFEDKDTGNSSPSFENNGGDSTSQDDYAETAVHSTFSYDQLKSKSENPVTGIDFKRREVGVMEISL